MTDTRALHRFAALPLFAGLDERDLSALVDAVVKRVQADKGALLYLQGEYDRTYYVLDRGAARLLRVEGDGSERVLREMQPDSSQEDDGSGIRFGRPGSTDTGSAL